MIKNLETELGIKLFYRNGRQVELTDAGQSMYVQAQEITKSFQNLTSELNDIMEVKKGHVRIGLPPMIGSGFFPRVLGDFRVTYPDVTFQLVEDGSIKVQQGVEDGSLDIGVVVLPANEEIFHTFTIVKETLMLVVHPSHRLADEKECSLHELKEEPFIFFREDFVLHNRIMTECVKAGFSLTSFMKRHSGTLSAKWYPPISVSASCRKESAAVLILTKSEPFRSFIRSFRGI